MIIDDLENNEVKIDEDDKALLLLSLLPRSFKNIKDPFFMVMKELLLWMRSNKFATKEFSTMKDLKVNDSGEGICVSR